jgi:hypothetical protein
MFGVNLFDGAGNLTLDVNDRTFRSYSTTNFYNLGYPYGTQLDIGVSGMSNDGSWLVITDGTQIVIRINYGYFSLINEGSAVSGTAYVFRM